MNEDQSMKANPLKGSSEKLELIFVNFTPEIPSNVSVY